MLKSNINLTQTRGGKIKCTPENCKPRDDEAYNGEVQVEKPRNKKIPKTEKPEEEYKYPADSLIELAREMAGKKKKKHRRRH